MVTFLAETYVPATTSSAEVERSAIEAAAALTAEGTPIRFLRSILVPEDETCFFVFEATSPMAVQEVTRRAGCGEARVSRASKSPRQKEGPDEGTTSDMCARIDRTARRVSCNDISSDQ